MISAMTPQSLTPPEVGAALETLRAARSAALPSAKARWGRRASYGLAWLIGTGVGFALVRVGLISPGDKELWRACLTAISVLSGFMIATMLFTGKIDVAKSLSLSELRDVSGKANYLLLYQFGTLLNHVLTLGILLLLPAFVTRWPLAGHWGAAVACGFVFVSLSRSVLIPLQIIELHRFTHAALLREKREEASRTDGI